MKRNKPVAQHSQTQPKNVSLKMKLLPTVFSFLQQVLRQLQRFVKTKIIFISFLQQINFYSDDQQYPLLSFLESGNPRTLSEWAERLTRGRYWGQHRVLRCGDEQKPLPGGCHQGNTENFATRWTPSASGGRWQLQIGWYCPWEEYWGK